MLGLDEFQEIDFGSRGANTKTLIPDGPNSDARTMITTHTNQPKNGGSIPDVRIMDGKHNTKKRSLPLVSESTLHGQNMQPVIEILDD